MDPAEAPGTTSGRLLPADIHLGGGRGTRGLGEPAEENATRQQEGDAAAPRGPAVPPPRPPPSPGRARPRPPPGPSAPGLPRPLRRRREREDAGSLTCHRRAPSGRRRGGCGASCGGRRALSPADPAGGSAGGAEREAARRPGGRRAGPGARWLSWQRGLARRDAPRGEGAPGGDLGRRSPRGAAGAARPRGAAEGAAVAPRRVRARAPRRARSTAERELLALGDRASGSGSAAAAGAPERHCGPLPAVLHRRARRLRKSTARSFGRELAGTAGTARRSALLTSHRCATAERWRSRNTRTSGSRVLTGFGNSASFCSQLPRQCAWHITRNERKREKGKAGLSCLRWEHARSAHLPAAKGCHWHDQAV